MISGVNYDFVPIMTSGSTISVKISSSCTLFRIDWQFIIGNFMLSCTAFLRLNGFVVWWGFAVKDDLRVELGGVCVCVCGDDAAGSHVQSGDVGDAVEEFIDLIERDVLELILRW